MRASRRAPEDRARERVAQHRYGDLVTAVADEATFTSRAMFGCVACYVHGRLKLVLADGKRPWNGVLVPTAREHHGSLRRTLPALRAHPVLGKWLHLPAGGDAFEDEVAQLVALVLADDDRVGVEPTPRRPRRSRPGTSRRPSRG